MFGNVAASWRELKNEAADRTRCNLYKCATQTMVGEGLVDAPITFVGERPGDREDLKMIRDRASTLAC